jgi:hypothetical protein
MARNVEGEDMSTITFDTLKYTKTLENAGVPRQQAEAQAVAQRESLEQALESHFEHAASREEVSIFKSEMKADFSSLRSEIKSDLRELELNMTIKLGGMVIALGGVLIAVKYLT